MHFWKSVAFYGKFNWGIILTHVKYQPQPIRWLKMGAKTVQRIKCWHFYIEFECCLILIRQMSQDRTEKPRRIPKLCWCHFSLNVYRIHNQQVLFVANYCEISNLIHFVRIPPLYKTYNMEFISILVRA